ncbi:UDP-glucose:(heptosyl)LPS alpha-1,3-glucosyltransferase [Candidatus Magnetomoraceae bacterium gMMP-15]
MMNTLTNIRKIAVVIPKYGLVGGVEKFVLELTERIAQNSHYEVHVFANKWKSDSDRITFHKIPIIIFPKFLSVISFAFFANRKIAKMDFDIIHSHERIFQADIFTMHGIPHKIWINEIRKKNYPSLFDYATMWVERCLLNNKKCQNFLAVSSLTKEKFLQEYNIDPEKLQIIHPGVNIDKFNKLNKQKCYKEVRKHFGINETDTVILFVGMNFEIKGLDNLMTAIAMTKSKCPNQNIKLLIVGKGKENKYRKLAYKLGINDDVIFAGVRTDVEQIYMACDIFSMLSKFDTFGMTVLEAMAASLPVIISENVGAKDLVRDGINGFVVAGDDINMIYSKIAFMLDKKNRKKMGQAAYETALENTWETLTEKVVTYFNQEIQREY